MWKFIRMRPMRAAMTYFSIWMSGPGYDVLKLVYKPVQPLTPSVSVPPRCSQDLPVRTRMQRQACLCLQQDLQSCDTFACLGQQVLMS